MCVQWVKHILQTVKEVYIVVKMVEPHGKEFYLKMTAPVV